MFYFNLLKVLQEQEEFTKKFNRAKHIENRTMKIKKENEDRTGPPKKLNLELKLTKRKNFHQQRWYNDDNKKE